MTKSSVFTYVSICMRICMCGCECGCICIHVWFYVYLFAYVGGKWGGEAKVERVCEGTASQPVATIILPSNEPI